MIKILKILAWFLCLLAFTVGALGSSIIITFALSFIGAVLLLHYTIKFFKKIPQKLKVAGLYVYNKIRGEYRSIIFLTIFVVSLVMNIVLITWYMETKGDCLSSVNTLILNIAGAFLALLLTYLLLRPNFEVAPIIARSLNNHICIVVKNESLFAKLYSIKFELAYCGTTEANDDEYLNNIALDSNSQVTLLTNQLGHKPIDRFNRYFIFKSVNGFYKQWAQLKWRISATNTISNIVDVRDKYIYYDAIQWGEYVGDKFYNVQELYPYSERQRVSKIIEFNETISKVLRPCAKKRNSTDAIYQSALNMLDTFIKDYSKEFPNIREVRPVADDLILHIQKLKNLLNQNEVLRPIYKERRNKLLQNIDKEFECISTHMENSLERKSLTIKI